MCMKKTKKQKKQGLVPDKGKNACTAGIHGICKFNGYCKENHIDLICAKFELEHFYLAGRG